MNEEGTEPRDDSETVDVTDWEKVGVVNTVREATLMAGFLRSNGIPATIESRFFTQEPVNIGTLGKVHVYVPKAQFAEAEQLLEQLEREPFDEIAGELPEADAEGEPAP